jgi:hypothetical protein
MPERDRRLATLFLAVTIAWSLALGLLGSTATALFCLPALLLAIPLALRRYLGADTLDAARELLRSRPPRALALAPRRPAVRPTARMVRGGLLVASSLAKRPPPSLVADLT